VAYLSILFDRYLAGIHNKKSQEYCVIAAYNTGSDNVLKAFSSDRQQAMRLINKMQPQQVYQHLTRKLAYAEARRYVAKVTKNMHKYQLT
jgi:membrane-bound lytic murein transglycosylase C